MQPGPGGDTVEIPVVGAEKDNSHPPSGEPVVDISLLDEEELLRCSSSEIGGSTPNSSILDSDDDELDLHAASSLDDSLPVQVEPLENAPTPSPIPLIIEPHSKPVDDCSVLPETRHRDQDVPNRDLEMAVDVGSLEPLEAAPIADKVTNAEFSISASPIFSVSSFMVIDEVGCSSEEDRREDENVPTADLIKTDGSCGGQKNQDEKGPRTCAEDCQVRIPDGDVREDSEVRACAANEREEDHELESVEVNIRSEGSDGVQGVRDREGEKTLVEGLQRKVHSNGSENSSPQRLGESEGFGKIPDDASSERNSCPSEVQKRCEEKDTVDQTSVVLEISSSSSEEQWQVVDMISNEPESSSDSAVMKALANIKSDVRHEFSSLCESFSKRLKETGALATEEKDALAAFVKRIEKTHDAEDVRAIENCFKEFLPPQPVDAGNSTSDDEDNSELEVVFVGQPRQVLPSSSRVGEWIEQQPFHARKRRLDEVGESVADSAKEHEPAAKRVCDEEERKEVQDVVLEVRSEVPEAEKADVFNEGWKFWRVPQTDAERLEAVREHWGKGSGRRQECRTFISPAHRSNVKGSTYHTFAMEGRKAPLVPKRHVQLEAISPLFHYQLTMKELRRKQREKADKIANIITCRMQNEFHDLYHERLWFSQQAGTGYNPDELRNDCQRMLHEQKDWRMSFCNHEFRVLWFTEVFPLQQQETHVRRRLVDEAEKEHSIFYGDNPEGNLMPVDTFLNTRKTWKIANCYAEIYSRGKRNN